LLGFRTGSQAGRSELWVLRADEPLQIGSHVKPDIQTSIPVDILRTIVRDVAQADASMSAPAATRCDYLEWTHGQLNVRLRQARTDTGWYASLETSLESDD
jgi:hypothetical protein